MKILFNGETRRIDDASTIASVLEQFEVERRRVAVEVNLEIVPRDRLDQYVLREGDRLEIVTLVGGG